MTRVSGALAMAVALGLFAALTSCGHSDSAGPAADRTSRGTATSHEPVAQTTPAATSTTPSPAAPPTGKPARGKHNPADEAFAANFITHHRQGVAMAQLLLAKSYIDPAVRALAERVRSEQAPQIERLRGWQQGFHRAVPAPNGSPFDSRGNRVGSALSPVPGMMSADDMAALDRLDGVEGAKLFLAMLVNHEIGGIQMANDELAAGRNSDAKRLAKTMIEMEQAVVSAANELLDGRMHPPGHF